MNLSRKDAIAALEPLKEAITTRAATESLKHIWFDGDFAYATNGGFGVRTKFESELECGVPGNLLLAMLNQAAADTIEFKAEDAALHFKVGRSNVKLATLPLENRLWRYPEKPVGKPLATIKVSEEFIKALKRVLVLRPSKPKRMEHYGVSIVAVESEMDLYTTDSNNLVVVPVSEPVVGSAKKLVIPRDLAETIIDQCVPGKDLKMYADHFVITANDNVTLYSNVFDTSEMLNFGQMANKFSDDKKSPPFGVPEGWRVTLEKAATLAGNEEPMVELKSLGKVLKISGKFKYGEIDEELDITKTVPKVGVFVNAKKLAAIEDIEKLAIYEGRALSLIGDDGMMYVLGGKSVATEVTAKSRKTQQKKAEAEDED